MIPADEGAGAPITKSPNECYRIRMICYKQWNRYDETTKQTYIDENLLSLTLGGAPLLDTISMCAPRATFVGIAE